MRSAFVFLAFCSLTAMSADIYQCNSVATYINSTSLTLSNNQNNYARNSWTLITLTGTALQNFTLFEWDLYWNVNGAIQRQFDEPVSGTYTLRQPVSVTYNMTIEGPSAYYSLKMMLQTSLGYYISCYQVNYFVSG